MIIFPHNLKDFLMPYSVITVKKQANILKDRGINSNSEKMKKVL